MKSSHKIIGILGVTIVASLGLTSCGMRSLPHDERYQYIDQVLKDIDYSNMGEIVEEKIDDGDGVFAPSYKEVYYKDESSYYKISERLKGFELSSCSGGETQTNCTYGGTKISVLTIDDQGRGTQLIVRDSSGGRKE